MITGWPELPLSAWQDTYATLQLYLQIAGKVRLALTPKMNQWWNVPFYVSTRGLTTSTMPYGERTFAIDFDFVDHNLIVTTSDGHWRALALIPRTVADFHRELFAMLRSLDLDVRIRKVPNEIPNPIPLDTDRIHQSYDAEYVERFWTIVRKLDQALKIFRARYRGKASPVHFFWGSFDLATSRFSGRPAPARSTPIDRITADAYDEEVSSVGFWPGDDSIGGAALYAYFAPEPEGYADARISSGAYYSRAHHEFLFPYDDLRSARDPIAAALEFAESTWRAGATLGRWDRAALEYPKARDPYLTGAAPDLPASPPPT